MVGKAIRLERIIDRNSKRTVIVPMDHGVTLGPIQGLQDMRHTINAVVEGGVNAIIIHKGIVGAGHRGSGRDVGLIIHLSGSTVLGPDPNAKMPVCTVEEAIRLGCDAVSIHVNVGAATEQAMLSHLANVARSCGDWAIPLVAMMYARGAKVDDEYAAQYVKHAARVGAELGADVVKCNYTGDPARASARSSRAAPCPSSSQAARRPTRTRRCCAWWKAHWRPGLRASLLAATPSSTPRRATSSTPSA